MKLSIALCSLTLIACAAEENSEQEFHSVERGSVVQEALAIGRVMPRVQVPIHSSWGGVVMSRSVKLGDRVEADDQLVEVRPQLTDRDRLEVKRRLAGAQDGLQSAKEIAAGKNLLGRAMRLFQGSAEVDRQRARAERSERASQTQLQLLEEGQATDQGLTLDWFVRAPISGTVVELPVELGQPITPASNFGTGSLLMTIADLDRPVLRGTVDELDAGRLKAGMEARIELGALPGVVLEGSLREISLIAGEKNGASVFDVVIDITPGEDVTLRAGYSAVARIVVAEAVDRVVIPERLVTYRSGPSGLEATVLVASSDGSPAELPITTGVSDGLVVEVTEGLAAGDKILLP